MAVPSVADVERIAAVADPVVRNLQITQSYHEWACALGARVAGHANWCSFATWASKQAGQTIRGEDLESALEHAFDRSLALDAAIQAVAARARALGARPVASEIKRVVRGALNIGAAFDRASDAVARGNLKVFAEIGHEFARYFAERCVDVEGDDAAISRFCSRLRDGDPPDGQRYLRQAFTRYSRALVEQDAKAREAHMLLANLEVGFHEQTRLQPEILDALNAAVSDPDEFAARLVPAVFAGQVGWFMRTKRYVRHLFGGPTPLDLAVTNLLDVARREVRIVITDHLMTLTLARGVRLRLGSDLPVAFPASLAHADDAELHAFLARVDPTPDSVRDSGAIDWGDLRERMHFIADLFRCYHESSELLDAPFDAEQLFAIKAGRRPAGPL